VPRPASPASARDPTSQRRLGLGLEPARQPARAAANRPPGLCGGRARDRRPSRARTREGGDLRDGPPDRLRRVRPAPARVSHAGEGQGAPPLLVRHRDPARDRAERLSLRFAISQSLAGRVACAIATVVLACLIATGPALAMGGSSATTTSTGGIGAATSTHTGTTGLARTGTTGLASPAGTSATRSGTPTGTGPAG